MATLLTAAPARPETVSPSAMVDQSPPPIVRKSRRRPITSQARIAEAANNGMWHEDDRPGTYLPSAEVIAAECAAIRANWSEEEHRLRRLVRTQRWTVQVVSLGEGMVSR